MQYLRANTEATVLIGPFIDPADGVTPVVDITLAGADLAELMKHDGTVFIDLAGDGRAWTHRDGGWYTLVLGEGDTDTEGRLIVVVMDADECLPVSKEFMVLAEAAFESLFVAKDTGLMAVDAALIADSVWDEVLTGATHNNPTSAGRRLRQSADVLFLHEGTCRVDGLANNEVKLADDASAVDDSYLNDVIVIENEAHIIQSRHIDSYVGETRVGTVNRDWQEGQEPDAATRYSIRADSPKHVHGFNPSALTQIKAEVLSALDTAIPGEPAADSVNALISSIEIAATLIKKIEQGRWKRVGTQMIFYDEDGVTPLVTFDLKDKNGQPTAENPFERSPV